MFLVPSRLEPPVNLDRLCRVDREWWDELLRRTGNATLHVKAYTIRKTDSPEFSFLKRILEDHWGRIQVLEIEVPYPVMERLIPAFQHPTTSLVVFHGEIIAPFPRHPSFSFDDPILFGNAAPLLRGFTSGWGAVNLSAKWSSQLRMLEIDRISMPPKILLEGLSQMPMLESLDLRHVLASRAVEPSYSIVEPVHLPRLCRLLIVFEHTKLVNILQNLTIPPNCRLHLGLRNCPDRSIALLQNVFTQLTEERFAHSNGRCALDISLDDVFFAIKETTESQGNFHALMTHRKFLPPGNADSYDLLCALKTCKLASISSLSAYIRETSPIPDSAIRLKLKRGPVDSFAHIFPHLETLDVTPYTLDVLFTCTSDTLGDPALPNLKILILRGEYIQTPKPERLKKFFTNRELLGLQMPILSLQKLVGEGI